MSSGVIKALIQSPDAFSMFPEAKAPRDIQFCEPQAATIPKELSFGVMDWTPRSYGDHVVFFATGAFVSYGRWDKPTRDSHQGIAARRLSKRIGTSRTIDTIIVTRKKK